MNYITLKKANELNRRIAENEFYRKQLMEENEGFFIDSCLPFYNEIKEDVINKHKQYLDSLKAEMELL